jgi:phosphinothricin acetyltransferase
MTYKLTDLVERDRSAVVAIFNYFVQHSFAAYPEQPVGDEFFDRVRKLSEGYPAVSARTDAGEVVGFGFLRAFHPAGTFRRTAEFVGERLIPERAEPPLSRQGRI